MKKKNQKAKCILICFFILTNMIFPLVLSYTVTKDFNLSSIDKLGEPFIYSINGNDYLAKIITAEDVEKMKEKVDTLLEQSNSESNIIIDGHGTGYTAPSLEDLDSLIGSISLLEVIPKYGQRYRATADISTEIYFPAVGDQGMQGSCSAWANAYYAYGYLEAKDYGWDASSGNPDYLLSPAWAYNIVSAFDYGSIPYEVVQVLLDWGIPTLSAMPYDDMDVDSWGDEVAWRQAPYHRPLNYTLVSYTGTPTIDLIKSLLSSGIPFTIGIDAYQFNNGLNQGTGDYILSSDEYDYIEYSLNHAQCFVGYDDAITEGSDVGAFRVVNSWGDAWMDNGYYWLTYDAFAEFAADPGQVLMYIEDRIDYNPDLIATWKFSDAPTRMDDIITIGVGPYDSPFNTTIPLYDMDTNNVFPDFMALDISEFYPYYTIDNDVYFFLEVGPSYITGTISSFKLERYSGGILQEISPESINVPEDTPGYVNGTFKIFPHELRVIMEVPDDPIIYNSYPIKATVINNGASDETNVDFELLLDGISLTSTTIPILLSGENFSLNYLWTPNLYDVYNFTARASIVPGEESSANNIITEIILVLGPIFYDDFESGLSKWTSITGMWHLTGAESVWPNSYHSPTHSMWFGNETTGNYNSSTLVMGDLTSIPIDLTGTDYATLEFYHWREAFVFDYSSVYISTDGIIWNQIYYSEDIIPPWEKVSIDISAYAGNPSVQIRFHFETLITGLPYAYRGWLVDDVMILGKVDIAHDLRVTLEVPETPEIGSTYTINATVTNIGSSDETNIDFFLYLNGINIGSLNIPTLTSGTSFTQSYIWNPTLYGEYNFTAHAPAIPGEEITFNNLVTEIIPIHEIHLFDGMFIDHIFSQTGANIPLRASYSYTSGSIYHVTWEGSYAGTPIVNYWDVDARTRIMQNSAGGLSFGENVHTPFWIFTDVSLGDIISIAIDGEGDHSFNITGDFLYDLPGFGLVDVWILEDLMIPGAIAWYEKSTGILLNGDFLYYGGLASYAMEFLDTNVNFEFIIFDHDLKVTLETPLSNKIDETYVINATVKNRGLNDENSVELFLYLDGISVSSTIIPTLTVGMEYTIQYIWTPTEYGSYNFTAHAPVVPLESYVENNRRTDIVYLFETELFNGLYVRYNFSQMDIYYNANFTYTQLTSRLYEEDFGLEGMGISMIYSYIVDALTRELSGGSIFVDGAHTPAWIFTNTSLYDLIPISSVQDGDHIFNVTSELEYDLPGFGLVEVWELEDLAFPGGCAWYEKSTGILLNGTFMYYGGMYNYTLDFIDTNAEITIISPPADFNLSSNADDPDDDGIFDLIWTEAYGSNNYSVYRHSSYITEINSSLTLLADEITDLSLALSGYTDGIYYFIVVAHNDYGDTRSNCLNIIIEIPAAPPGDFTLSSNAGDPDDDGTFTLTWTASSGAVSYSVYSYSGYITEINASLTLLAGSITDLSLPLTGYDDGDYYFIVVAQNEYGNTRSNCLKVTVDITKIPGYDLVIIIATIGVVVFVLIKKKLKK